MSTRERVIKASASLTVRNILGMFIGTGGVFLLTSTIGPTAFGEYVAVFGVATFATGIGSLGVSVYLVRKEHDPTPETYNQAFTLLMASGIGSAILLIAALPLLSDWMNVPGIEGIAIALFALAPFSLASVVPMAMIERRLDYGRVAVIELLGQIVIYVVALPAAFLGLGSWAPVLGWIAHRLFLTAALFVISGYRPRLRWDPIIVKEILAYGISYSASSWIWNLRKLVNPMIVTRYAGVEAVAYISLAIRFIEALSFIKNITWRISVAAFAKLQSNPRKLSKAIEEGTEYQAILVASIYLAFSFVGPWLMEFVYEPRWMATMQVFPFIAVGYLANTLFNLHCSALYVLKRNFEVGIFHAVHVALFATAAYWFTPKYGLIGYGWSELVALFSYAIIYFLTNRHLGNIHTLYATALSCAFGIALFWPILGWPAFVLLGPIVVLPKTWQTLKRMADAVLALRSKSPISS